MVAERAIETTVIKNWKEEIGELLALQYDDSYEIDYEELYRQLDEIVMENFTDVPAILHNNYRMRDVSTSLTEMASCVLDNMCILGGDACLYHKHDTLLSMNVPIIGKLKKRRSAAKEKMYSYEDGSDEYIYWDRVQKNIKIIINSLYGVLGCPSFVFYNVNIARSITAMGRSIISTASCGYENFNEGNVKFVNLSELVHYINNVVKDYKLYKDDYQSLFVKIDNVEPKDVVEVLRGRLAFDMTDDAAKMVARMIRALEPDCVKMLYYKNNIDTFNQTPLMKRKLKELFSRIDVLTLGDEKAFLKPEKTGTVLKEGAYDTYRDVMDAYRVMVQYNYPTYDSVRRTRYTEKKSVLYIDTDSNFISLDKYVRYVINDINGESYDTAPGDEKIKISSLYTMVMSDVVARNFVRFTRLRNITDEYGQKLQMKNEFYFSRMAFNGVKKRYFGWKMTREGKKLKGGKGDLEIKGFDFIKAGTKKSIRTKYSDFVHKILLNETLNVHELIIEALSFKEDIHNEIMNGSSEYFKQCTVNLPEHYKLPYSQQGIKAVLVWNAMNPDDALSLPCEVDLVPITLAQGYTEKRIAAIKLYGPRPCDNPEFETVASSMPYLLEFAKKYPDAYELFWKEILNNDNEHISGMEFSKIAKPRHVISLPEWFHDIIDMDKVIGESVSLLTPVLQSTGIKSTKVGKVNHYTNIVEV